MSAVLGQTVERDRACPPHKGGHAGMKKPLLDRRGNMLAAVRLRHLQRQLAAAFEVVRSTLQWWLARSGPLPLEQIDWHMRLRALGRVR